jgi:uncharacterized protein
MRRDRNGMEVLSKAECLSRLGATGLGRIAVVNGTEPVIFPVNYATYHGGIVFRTGPGAKLAAAARRAVLAFEVDGFDAVYHTGWSVLIVGPARVVTDAAELRAVTLLPLSRWAPASGREAIVHLRTHRMSGRQITYEVA